MKRSIVFTDHELDALERFYEVLEDSTDLHNYMDRKDINIYRRLKYVTGKARFDMMKEREAKLRGEL